MVVLWEVISASIKQLRSCRNNFIGPKWQVMFITLSSSVPHAVELKTLPPRVTHLFSNTKQLLERCEYGLHFGLAKNPKGAGFYYGYC